jgi:hypothetical protein
MLLLFFFYQICLDDKEHSSESNIYMSTAGFFGSTPDVHELLGINQN